MKRNRVKHLCTAATAFALSTGLLGGSAGMAQDMTFTSWTGPYMRSQMLGYVVPYENLSGSRINVDHYNGGIDEIRDQVESANVKWDVVDLTQADSLRACNAGLLENIEDIEFPAGVDGTPFKEDFIEGALNPCGVGVIVWGTVFAFSDRAYTDEKPTTIADFFDTAKFPGPRAIRNDPSVIMEWALIADGVAVADVYSTLSTPEGVERALKKMESIKGGLVLWETGNQPVRLLADGDVTMSAVWATTGVQGSQQEGSDFTVSWDGRVIEMDLFGIPKGSRNKAAAIEFIKFASSSTSMANQANYLPNGPTRKSSLALIPEDIQAQLPNGSQHDAQVSILSNAQWWADNHDTVAEAFNAWVAEAVQKGAAGTVR